MNTFKYFFNLVTLGYFWNIQQRVLITIGLQCAVDGNVGGQTCLQFPRELTPSELTAVNNIMANNPSYPPNTSNNVALITDIWNERAAFVAATGLDFDVYYDESSRGSGNVNQIKLHYKKVLNNTEKNRVKSEYAKLMSI